MKATTGWAAGCVIGLAVLLCARSAPIQAASPAPNAAAAGGRATQLSGTFAVSIALDVSKGLPDGTQVSADASAQLQGDPLYGDEAGLDATATVSGGKVSITLDIPYTWDVTSTADTVIVALNVSASAPGSNVQLQYSSYFTQTIALPKNGATTPVKITGSL